MPRPIPIIPLAAIHVTSLSINLSYDDECWQCWRCCCCSLQGNDDVTIHLCHSRNVNYQIQKTLNLTIKRKESIHFSMPLACGRPSYSLGQWPGWMAAHNDAGSQNCTHRGVQRREAHNTSWKSCSECRIQLLCYLLTSVVWRPMGQQ